MSMGRNDDSLIRHEALRLVALERKKAAKRIAQFEEVMEGIHEHEELRRRLKDLDRTLLYCSKLEKQSQIVRPPASRLTGLLRLIFTRKAFEQVFSQVILDGREEYNEALAEGKINLARYRAIRLYGILIFTIGMWAISSIAYPIAKIFGLGK